MLGTILKTIIASTGLILSGFAQTIPAGIHLTVRMGQEISSGTAKAATASMRRWSAVWSSAAKPSPKRERRFAEK